MINRFQWVLFLAISTSLALVPVGSALALTAGPGTILNGDASYSGTGITVSPFAAGGSPGLFGVSGTCCLGVQGGANNVGVDDVDGIQGGSDAERMDFILDPNYGLIGMDFIFTRANPIVISGFTNDPQVTLGNNPNGNITASYDSNSNSVLVFHPWAGGNVVDLTFGNPGASVGQTISLSAFDPGQAGPQAVLFEFEWDIASATIAGDVDGDGDVDLVETGSDPNDVSMDGMSDFDIIRDNWFNSASPARTDGDLNGDGIVEFDDFAEWKAEFPFPIVGSIETGFTVIPEPSSLLLMSSALVLLAVRNRK